MARGLGAVISAASAVRIAVAIGLVIGIVLAAGAGSSAAPPREPTSGRSEPLGATLPSPTPGASAFPTSPLDPPDEGDDLASELIAPGQLTICSSFPRVRFAEFDADGRPFGVDIEIGQEIARRLGLEPDVHDLLFEDLIDAVVNSACDVSIAGQFITSGRLEAIDMVPYRQGTPHVVVQAGNPLAINELIDLCGRALAVVAGTVHVEMARGLGDYAGSGIDDRCREADLPLLDVREHLDQQAAEDALDRGDADAYAGNDFVAVDRPADFATSAELPPVRNGIGHRKGAVALDAAVRATLGSMIDDRAYLLILERYDVAHAAVTSRP